MLDRKKTHTLSTCQKAAILKIRKETPIESRSTSPTFFKSMLVHAVLVKRTRPKVEIGAKILFVVMKLKLGLLLHDISFRFDISIGTACSIFTTWVKLCSKERSFWLYGPTVDKMDG